MTEPTSNENSEFRKMFSEIVEEKIRERLGVKPGKPFSTQLFMLMVRKELKALHALSMPWDEAMTDREAVEAIYGPLDAPVDP